jgi:predicted HTH domain antitoxin
MAVSLPALHDEWLIEALPRLYRDHPDVVQAHLRNLLTEQPEVRWSLVVWLFQEGRINLGKAAELLGMHEIELRERFIKLGVPLRLGASGLAEGRAEVAAVRAWYSSSEEP